MIKDIGDKTMSLGDYVGLKIRFVRESKGLTAKELSTLVSGLTEDQVIKYEEGIERPPSRTIRAIYKAMNVDTDHFFS